MAQATTSSILWDPALLVRAESLEWRSRVVVDGFLQGFHRSRLRGFSAEFAQYQPYIRGDDLRYLDWRAYARLDRLYVRQFESETNLRCQVLLDASGSMDYRSEGVALRKFDYAAIVAAVLMRLMQSQNDAFGVSLCKKRLVGHIPPHLSRGHLMRCLGMVETAAAEGELDLPACINTVADLLHKRGLMVLLTDGWADIERVIAGLQRLRFDHHEIIFLQVVDPRELDFGFAASQLFEDMETGAKLPVTPQWSRPRYLAAIERHQARLQTACLDLGVTYRLMPTDQPPFNALAAFLAERGRR